MSRPFRLSVLDQSIAVAGRPQDQSIRNTVALAEHCEALGYERFWVSEHHNHPTIVGTAPEIVMAAIAARTERIRIGSAGIMLPHYSAFKVAEVFRVLDALAPGRIDLGLGRAPGSDGRTAFALNPAANERPEHFPADVRDLIAWVHNEPLVDRHPFAAVKAFPQSGTAPEIWILGSSDYGAQVAALFGLPYCYAWFFSDGAGGERAIDLYKRSYRPSARHPEPRSGLCVWALAAETMDKAQYHFTSRALSRIQRDKGLLGPLLAPDEAAKVELTLHEQAKFDQFRKDSFVGTGPEVAQRITELKERVGVDEMAVVTWTHDEEVRRQSYTLLAEAYGFAPAS
ncbi:MAG: LLM class flavin-dependent oxidoreductase [Reyranella sp.]|jgi:luciferase family oxidoreductase group 1|uniref:LLM class flavin-dependent oxidoreductase n=1 Tax=Reyranella sp. TaxID=1929291 RepID=UPI000961D846|nr:LLM class flavin-dependent oxidoreductase [Reyranella sp.]MBN9537975.1 LLM class flavin-dependent oxidoreductase [Alphaproteobacteria bacterium]MBR2814189.1 LLM class flavin-dependent oxidoreductase [Reyranella sp.]OJU46008.1 MAG: luciferase [Alphaproteobacteria bacterium 65-37]